MFCTTVPPKHGIVCWVEQGNADPPSLTTVSVSAASFESSTSATTSEGLTFKEPGHHQSQLQAPARK